MIKPLALLGLAPFKGGTYYRTGYRGIWAEFETVILQWTMCNDKLPKGRHNVFFLIKFFGGYGHARSVK